MRFAQDNQQIGEFAVPEANQGVGVDAKHFYSVDNQAIGKYDKTTGKHAACTRRVSADPGACSGGIVTQIQSGSSRADSPVRILYAQPRSPVSARQKVNVARTMASERARGCCCACFVFALQWKPLIIVGRYRRAFSRAWTSLPLTPSRLHLRRRVHAHRKVQRCTVGY